MMVALGGSSLEDPVRLATFCGPFPSTPPVVSPYDQSGKSTVCNLNPAGKTLGSGFYLFYSRWEGLICDSFQSKNESDFQLVIPAAPGM